MTTSEDKRDRTTLDAPTNDKVNPFVWFCEECKRVVRFLCDLFFPWPF